MQRKQPLDERQIQVFRTLAARFYIFTLLFLVTDIMIRQFVLHQDPSRFEDLNVLMVLNVVLFLSTLLYGLGMDRDQTGPLRIVAGYAVLVGLGLVVLLIKYGSVSWRKAGQVATISGLLVLIYAAAARLGGKRVQSQLDDGDN